MSEPEELKKKRGRPMKDGARRFEAKTHFNKEEYDDLIYLSEQTGESYSEILRKAFNTHKVLRKMQLKTDENDNF